MNHLPNHYCKLLASASLWASMGFAANQMPEQQKALDLTDLSVEALMALDVSSVTKKSSEIKDVPAAISVLTADDIRRSGATSIPEALRVVPGLHVARIDGNKWAVSARGFTSQFANKLLVLMDGRSLYTPLFSGVWWDQEDVLMEDIERIEVIRGSGTSLWGANAVNGVINIITKNAQKTQGGLVSGQGGTMRKAGGLRYGVELGHHAYMKVYGRYAEYDPATEIDPTTRLGTDKSAGDDSRLGKIGFRFDKDFSNTDKLTFQGDAFSGFSGGGLQEFPRVSANLTPVLAPPYSRLTETDFELSGHYVLGRWEHRLREDSSTVLRMYWNRGQRQFTAINSSYQIDTLDVDFQHNARLNASHHLLWGTGIRLNINDTQNSPDLSWTPSQRQDDIYTFFVQDDITLVPERWRLTLGSKFEHNPVTRFEWQPNARLLWTPVKEHSFWSSVSRSVRTPNWAEQDMSFNITAIPPVGGSPAQANNPVALVSSVGNKTYRAEEMRAYELGWRGELSSAVTADVALYYCDYQAILSVAPNAPDFSHLASGYLLQTLSYANYGAADIYGGEASLDWLISSNVKLRASYVHTEQQFSLMPHAPVGTTNPFADSSSTHQAMLWAMFQLNPQIKLDLNWRYVSNLSSPGPVSGYHEMDARLAWALSKHLEIALVGRNLLDKQHVEFGSYFASVPTAVQREVFATIRWGF